MCDTRPLGYEQKKEKNIHLRTDRTISNENDRYVDQFREMCIRHRLLIIELKQSIERELFDLIKYDEHVS
jgi:hypothetical protein